MKSSNPQEVMHVWWPFLAGIEDWERLVKGVTPKATGCGPVYEITNPVPNRPNESFAIADMRDIGFAEPHYHTNGEYEIYVGLTGLGKVVVGGKESELKPGTLSITPPDVAHFVVPRENLVIAVINTPPFNAENVVPLTESNPAVRFDAEQLARLRQEVA